MKCLNDPDKSFKGDEPSPKGLGYCAHAEHVGTKMIGKDGNNWVIQTTSKGIKRWVKDTFVPARSRQRSRSNSPSRSDIELAQSSSVIKRMNRLKEKYLDTGLLDEFESIYEEFVNSLHDSKLKTGLTLNDVLAIKNKKIKYLWVFEPQSYNITKLTSGNMMFEDKTEKYGYFYDCGGIYKDNFAYSGSGCDMWFVVNDTSLDLLEKACKEYDAVHK